MELNMDSAKKKGSYFGTEIDGKWWKRYKKDGLFARGKGQFWMDEEGIRFHRLLTREPLLIRWGEMTGTRLGKWHAGQWAIGRPILKVEFERSGLHLSAGFYLANDWQGMSALSADLNRKLNDRS